MLLVHEEKRPTGEFRIRRTAQGAWSLQCQVVIHVKNAGAVVEQYYSWRTADDDAISYAQFRRRHGGKQ